MSMAKTTKAITEGVEVYARQVDEIFGLKGGKGWPPWILERDLNAAGIRWEWSGDLVRIWKDVTRRSSWVPGVRVPVQPGGWRREPGHWKPGWQSLKAGDVVELVEWSPRVGPRWACECGWLGIARPRGLTVHEHADECDFPDCGCPAEKHFRGPRRLGLREVVSARPERLGDITPVEVAREGFPGMTPEDFIKRYCSGKPDPDRPCTRIELREVAP
jgi:hypothetical protein